MQKIDFMGISAIVTRMRSNHLAKQCGLLIGMQGGGVLLSFAFTILITRGLDVGAYGMFRYAMTFLAMGMTVLQFGWPYSAARLLALETEVSAQKQIVGASAILVVISTVAGTAITMAALFTADAFGYHLPRILIWVSPFLFVTLGQGMISSICQGLNRIALLSFQQVLPYLFLLPVTAIQVFVYKVYSLHAAIIGYVVVFSFVITGGFWRLGVSFMGWRHWLQIILKENRKTGFPMYIGGIFGVASAQIIAMWVVQFVDPSRYGQYALAVAVSSPLSVIVSSVGTVLFRSSSSSRALSNAVLFYTVGFVCLLAILYYVAAEVLLVRAFGIQYANSVRMAQILGLGSLMIGLADVFSRFLGAQGQGKRLGIAAVVTGSVGIVSASILLPKWNAYGAIASSVLGATAYLVVMLGLYIRHTMPQTQDQLGITTN